MLLKTLQNGPKSFSRSKQIAFVCNLCVSLLTQIYSKVCSLLQQYNSSVIGFLLKHWDQSTKELLACGLVQGEIPSSTQPIPFYVGFVHAKGLPLVMNLHVVLT